MNDSLIVEKVNDTTMSVSISMKDRAKFYRMLGLVKSLPGRKYVSNQRAWYVPIELSSLDKLRKWGFLLSSDLLININKKEKPKPSPIIKEKIKQDKKYEKLYSFQKKGVEAIDNFNGRILIADEMGLGKTVQALTWLRLHPELRPALIIMPGSLKLNWYKEIQNWMSPKEKVHIVNGRYNNVNKIEKEASIYLANYDILYSRQKDKKDENKTKVVARPDLVEIGFNTIIVDECHNIKNSKTNKSKAVKQFTKKADNIIALSGTPILNKPIEFYPILNILDPTSFSSFWNFAHSYCAPYHNGFGWVFNGATNTSELNKILKEKIMVRNLKKDVMKDLPNKITSVIPFSISNQKTYENAEKDIISWIKENEGKEKAEKAQNALVLVQFEKLKQLASAGKTAMVEQWLEDYLSTDQKIVLFATHYEIIDYWYNKYKNIAVKFDGRDSFFVRDKAVEEFQNNSGIKIFIGNIKAAGAGITLTAANSVAFLELGWTPGEHLQAEDRIHRIGQTSESVNIFYLIADGTVELDIMELLDKKKNNLNKVLDGKEAQKESLLTELKNSYVERKK